MPLLQLMSFLQHCLPQGWVARILPFSYFPPSCQTSFLRFPHKHPYHLCLYTLTAFEKHTIRFDAPREKREGKVGYLLPSAAGLSGSWHTPVFFLLLFGF